MEQHQQYASPEQLAYASWLDTGMKLGFLLLVGTFVVYLLGLTTPQVPVEQLPKYWTMPVAQYLKAADVHTGWSWLALIGKGDYMNFLGIAVLEIAVLVLAASGLLVVGH